MTTSGTKHGFTLLELILVAALIAIGVAIGAPYFAQSIRGNRLRIGARTVAMAARYARSMAVMRQQTFILKLNMADDSLTISPVNGKRPDPTDGLDPFEERDAPSPEIGRGLPAESVQRKLSGVRFAEYRPAGGDWQDEGTLEILFFPNGTCSAFELRLKETGGRGLRLQVDELGTVRTLDDEGFG